MVTEGFLAEAALLVAGQSGAARRLRARHRRRADGTCTGCGHALRTRWPCVLVTIANLSGTVNSVATTPSLETRMADPKTPDKPGRHEDDRDGKGVPQPDRWKDPNKK